MKLGIIGYKGHSQRIIKILEKNKNIKQIIIYCRKKSVAKILEIKKQNKNIFYTSDLSNLFDLNGVFISSKSDSHVYYIKKFEKKNVYIFCEKPAFTIKSDFKYLDNLDNKIKKKIYFNFNYKKSKLFKDLNKIIKNKKYGKVLHANIDIGHGLAFKKGLKQNWRFSEFNIFNNIAGNLGVHYINFLESYFGKSLSLEIYISSISRKRSFDTATIIASYKNNISSKVFLSYASPFLKEISIYMSNGIVVYSNKRISVYYPRETYDKNSFFMKPKKNYQIKYKKEYTEDSLENSINYFVNKVKNNNYFPLSEY
ncbi:Gfo/Idh/MocA family oxidoreductase, partial [Pelagibacteraceae bacterium]|nr:Gfo/Idh/MocA family oxidoreductase [Pelagibacteraceae bacterium]